MRNVKDQKAEGSRQKAARRTLRMANGEWRIFTEKTKKSSEDVGHDFAAGLGRLARADLVPLTQSLNANRDVAHLTAARFPWVPDAALRQ